MVDKLIGSRTIKHEPYYQSKSGSSESLDVCTFGDSDNGIVEQDLRKYILKNGNKVLIEKLSILSSDSIKGD